MELAVNINCTYMKNAYNKNKKYVRGYIIELSLFSGQHFITDSTTILGCERQDRNISEYLSLKQNIVKKKKKGLIIKFSSQIHEIRFQQNS